MSHKYYTAKDIEKYLGINANTLYHWVQTRRLLKPKKEGIGRGKSNYFTIDNLVVLNLIKKLNNMGIELSFIKKYLISLEKPLAGDSTKENREIAEKKSLRIGSLWEHIKQNKKSIRKSGLLMLIIIKEDKVVQAWVGSQEEIIFRMKCSLMGEMLPRGELVIINLMEMIEGLERVTREKY